MRPAIVGSIAVYPYRRAATAPGGEAVSSTGSLRNSPGGGPWRQTTLSAGNTLEQCSAGILTRKQPVVRLGN